MALLAVAACGGGDGDDAATLRAAPGCAGSVGFMAPVTGPTAALGREQRNWARYAVDRYNDERGTRFELAEADTALDPARAGAAAERFAADARVLAVVGPAASQEVEAAAPVLGAAGVALVSASATEAALGGRYPTFFRVVPHDDTQGRAVARYLLDELRADDVVVVDDQTPYSTALAEGVAGALHEGGARVARRSVGRGQPGFEASAGAVGDDVDAVFLPWQVAADAERFARELERQRKRVVVFGGDGLFSPEDFAVEGAYVSSLVPDVRRFGPNRELVGDYAEAYDDRFGAFGPAAFAATTVVLDAATAACARGGGATRPAVLAAVRATDQPASILGSPISFDARGDLVGARSYVFRVRDGRYVPTGE